MKKSLGKVYWKDAIRRKIIHSNLLLDKCPNTGDTVKISSEKLGVMAEIDIDEQFFIEKALRHLAYNCQSLEECLLIAENAWLLKQEKIRLENQLKKIKDKLNN